MRNLTLEEETKHAMKKFGIKALKKFGQNFIIDETALDLIIKAADINNNDYVLEIGPGLGTMTKLLCEKANSVIAVEIDKQMVDMLNINMGNYKNLKLINGDILQINLDSIIRKETNNKFKVVANLPYYITSPIVMKLLESKDTINTITLLVQKEVAERIAATPGGKDYGVLSIAVQYHSIPKIIATVPSESFLPKPEVDSAILHLIMRDKVPVSVKDEKLFFRVIRSSFSKRRKILINSLNGSELNLEKKVLEKILRECEIDPKRRAETLTIEEFASLSNRVYFLYNK